GSDYIFPRMTNLIVGKYLQSKGLAPVAEKYTPLGHRDYADIVQEIKKQKPDVILSTINGDSNIRFYRDLALAGITPAETVVVALLIDEDDLRGLDPRIMKGHFAAWNYFQNLDTPRNKQFVQQFQARYGKDRATTDAIEAAYFQVYLWKLAVEKAKSI